jgi:uncharacterized membrane-anchored protein
VIADCSAAEALYRCKGCRRQIKMLAEQMWRAPPHPTLKLACYRDTVIIDNLPAHKADAVEKAVKAARASRLYLPKYSPDLNPIEQASAN